MSLRLRVVFAITAVLLLVAGAAVALLGWQARLSLTAEMAAALDQGQRTAASAFEDLPRSDHAPRDLAQLVGAFDGARHLTAAVEDAHGRTVLASRPATAGPAPRWFARLLVTPTAARRIAVPAAGYGALVLRPAYGEDLAAFWDEFAALAAALAAALILVTALVWLTLGRALRPLTHLSRAFDAIGSGDLDARVDETGPPELASLAGGVNAMASRLAAAQDRADTLEAQLLTLQEEERADLARDLHDEVGPLLFAASVDAASAHDLIGAGRTAEAQARVLAIGEAVGGMRRLVRDILGRLRPTELADLGLGPAVEALVAFWRARHPDIAFDLALPADAEAIAPALRETCYRIVQEGLSNAVRHARAGAITVELVAETGGGATCVIADDGEGAGGAEAVPAPGRGLKGMAERVRAVGGVLDIVQAEGRGWRVRAGLPGPVGETEGAKSA